LTATATPEKVNRLIATLSSETYGIPSIIHLIDIFYSRGQPLHSRNAAGPPVKAEQFFDAGSEKSPPPPPPLFLAGLLHSIITTYYLDVQPSVAKAREKG
jgi:hypothetical protein